ncbi:SubName: Full=Related to triacylglycerol lipase {ECO:0000313/EMBL:CCA73795.1} [Serendipita indica DSM 11827]|uniref:Related to triacylglycerol lipase n=1 Tax=Serendipita indica (strain DSM 11827) TaxID=1109443 RepID=G4TR52_SERID|nr:SubName: Full=Related to triacylglycerol lipase {ECO:0000313/EMBL:CCA73795.1} [Serendipita indica DSM 11827]CCA73795.1 related to triacylglycerol lipase precursor [Serendipita indica DSM 11827]
MLRLSFLSLIYVLATLLTVRAGPLVERQLSTLTTAQINSFNPYALFAKSAYCDPATTQAWSCTSCSQLTGFKTVASGGNGGSVQYWYVGYYPTFSSIVVGYQGTDPSKFEAILTDLSFIPITPSQSLFPGLPSAAKVHGGFLNAYTASQAAVLAAIQQAASTYGTKKVTFIGHSLGGALSVISAASMKLRLGSSYTFKVVTYGSPRIGDRDWASWVDSNLDITRIGNKKDPVPILPGRSLGFQHSKGEIHIRNSDSAWVNCPGNDNTASGCTIADTPNILVSNVMDHLGPYNGITIDGC